MPHFKKYPAPTSCAFIISSRNLDKIILDKFEKSLIDLKLHVQKYRCFQKFMNVWFQLEAVPK